MPLPTTPDSWFEQFDIPNQLFGAGRSDYELYEEEDGFVLTVELPGVDPDDISLAWDSGVLNIGAENTDEEREQRRTYHRRFRFPKQVAADDITAEYTNGVLEVFLPIEEVTVSGREIPVQ
jgi:HSP20 family protein